LQTGRETHQGRRRSRAAGAGTRRARHDDDGSVVRVAIVCGQRGPFGGALVQGAQVLRARGRLTTPVLHRAHTAVCAVRCRRRDAVGFRVLAAIRCQICPVSRPASAPDPTLRARTVALTLRPTPTPPCARRRTTSTRLISRGP